MKISPEAQAKIVTINKTMKDFLLDAKVDPMSVHQQKDLQNYHPTISKEAKESIVALMSKENTPKWGKKLPIESGCYIGCASKPISFQYHNYSPLRHIKWHQTFPLHVKTWNMGGKRKYLITMSLGHKPRESLQSITGTMDDLLPVWHKEPWKDILISQQPLSAHISPPVEGELLAFDFYSSIDIASIQSEITILKGELNSLLQLKAVDVSSFIKELQAKILEREQKIIKLKGETIIAPSKPKPKKETPMDDDILL